MRPQSIVLFTTPKFISDFSNSEPDIVKFYDRYRQLTDPATETIVIFSVGNSDHILEYGGAEVFGHQVEWARVTDGKPITDRLITYDQIAGIVRVFREQAAQRGINVKVYDQIDSGNEFTITNRWKYDRHMECNDNEWLSYDVGATLKADTFHYATAPNGIVEGTNCGEFLVNQTAAYLRDLQFDGILYDNQLGTRGRWLPKMSPGFSTAERDAISAFLEYSQRELGDKELMWFDTYNKIEVEQTSWSFPADGYGRFDYVIASGFCVVTNTDRYLENLRSKLTLRNRTRVIATLDYVDPWYSYNSIEDFPKEARLLEEIAIEHRFDIDGLVFFANDDDGSLIAKQLIDSFAARYFQQP